MIQNFRNIYFTINGNQLAANSIDINSDTLVQPYYDNDDFITDKFNTNGPQLTSIKFNYALTGIDPLYSYIENRTGTISGNFGGYFFRNGYLKSYNFDLSPNNSISVSTEISLFDCISGTFNPSVNNINTINNVLDASNVSISNGNGINLTNENIVGLRLNFTNDLVPSYYNNSILPNAVYISRKNITAEIDTDSENISIPYSGQNISFDMVLKDQNNNSIHSFNISGRITNKSFKVSSASIPINTFKVIQPTLFNNVIISGFNPLSGRYGDYISISGLNMEKVSSVYFFDMVQSIFTYNGVNTVTAQVPIGAISGELGIFDLKNIKYRAGDFRVIDDGIIIQGFSPSSGGYYAVI